MEMLIILFLVIIIILLSFTLYYYSMKSTFISKKEKEYLNFVINIFEEFADDLGIQSKEQHKKLVDELNNIKKKHLIK